MKSFKQFINEAPSTSIRPAPRPTSSGRTLAPSTSIRPAPRPQEPVEPELMVPLNNFNRLDPDFDTPPIYRRSPEDPNRPVPLVPPLALSPEESAPPEVSPSTGGNLYRMPYRQPSRSTNARRTYNDV